MCKTSHQAISHRVKSASMSTWTMDEVHELTNERSGGNDAARHVWLLNAPPYGQRYNGGTRPKSGDRIDIFKQFVVDCYEYGKFKASSAYDPSTSLSASDSSSTPPTPGRSSGGSTPKTPVVSARARQDEAPQPSSLRRVGQAPPSLSKPAPVAAAVDLLDTDAFATSASASSGGTSDSTGSGSFATFDDFSPPTTPSSSGFDFGSAFGSSVPIAAASSFDPFSQPVSSARASGSSSADVLAGFGVQPSTTPPTPAAQQQAFDPFAGNDLSSLSPVPTPFQGGLPIPPQPFQQQMQPMQPMQQMQQGMGGLRLTAPPPQAQPLGMAAFDNIGGPPRPYPGMVMQPPLGMGMGMGMPMGGGFQPQPAMGFRGPVGGMGAPMGAGYGQPMQQPIPMGGLSLQQPSAMRANVSTSLAITGMGSAMLPSAGISMPMGGQQYGRSMPSGMSSSGPPSRGSSSGSTPSPSDAFDFVGSQIKSQLPQSYQPPGGGTPGSTGTSTNVRGW
jgi:hypothetical protein